MSFKFLLSAALLLLTGAGATGATVSYSFGNLRTVPQKYGTQKIDDYDVAIHVTDPSLVGARISGFKVPFDAEADASDFSVWLSRDLNLESKVNAPDILSVPAKVSGGNISVTFDDPYVIPEEGVYVGYSFKIASNGDDASRMPLSVYSSSTNPEGFYIHTKKKYLKWQSIAQSAKLVSAIELKLEGDFPGESASWTGPSSIDVDSELKNFEVLATYMSYGSEPVKTLEYTYCFNGGEEKEDVYEYNPSVYLQFGSSSKVRLRIPNETEVGINTLRLTLKGINGKPNPNPNNTFETQVYRFDLLPVKRPLMEEYTGLWCGFCVRGLAAMEYMRKKYPDDFIAVSIHTDDMMQTIPRDQLPGVVPGLPGAWIDRDFVCDPYTGRAKSGFGLEADWLLQKEVFAPVKLDVTARWSADNDKVIEADTKAVFIRKLTGEVRFFYYLLADGLSHPLWEQKNYYTAKDYPMQLREMDKFTVDNAGSIRGLVYDDVAIMFSPTGGIEESLPEYTSIVAEEPYSHSYSFNTDLAYSLKSMYMGNATNFRVVVGVLDVETGKVLNAAFADLAPNQSGVNGVRDTEVVEISYHTLEGLRVENPGHGLYIRTLRHADGTVTATKVML